MPNNLPKYLITDESEDGEELGVSQVAYTSTPAIIKRANLFNDIQKQYMFKDELKGIVAGPIMIPDILIYRRDDELGEYNVVFTKQRIESLYKNFMKNKDKDVFNLDHKKDKQVGDKSFILESWITGPSETDLSKTKYGVEVPEGSAFFVSQFTDMDYFKKEIVEMDRAGYSIEGMLGLEFKRIESKLKQELMKNKSRKFESVDTADGGKIFLESEVAVDAYVYCDEPYIQLIDGKKSEVRSPVWEPIIELTDGRILNLENGKIVEIKQKETSAAAEDEALSSDKNKNQEMNKTKNELAKQLLAEANKDKEIKLSVETLKDGTKIAVSELVVGGTADTTDENGEVVPLFDGEHELEDGKVIATVGGKITEIKNKEELAEGDEAPASTEPTAENTNVEYATKADLDALYKSIAELKTLIETKEAAPTDEKLNAEKKDKFEVQSPKLSNLFKQVKGYNV